MKRTATALAVAAGLTLVGAGTAHADTFSTSTTISASCHGVHVAARGYNYQAGTPGNDYLVAIYTKGVPSWSFGFFQSRTDVQLSVPQDGLRHRVQVWVHRQTDPAGVSTTLSETVGRCS